MSDDDAAAPPVPASSAGGGPQRPHGAQAGPAASEYRALIRALLRQTPEERLLGLRRASAFFAAARRV